MTSLILSKVGYRLPDRELFRDLNMTLGNGRQALVGPNGIGKSTLAKIIAREIEPDEGCVSGAVHVVVHRQFVLEVLDDPSIRDVRIRRLKLAEIFGRSSRARFPWAQWLRQIPDREDIAFLSGGERMRLRLLETLGEAICREDEGFNALIVLDEPTNDLDREGREFVYEWIRAREDGLLVISHDRELLQEVDQIFELSNIGLKSYSGGYREYAEAVRDERERDEKLVCDSERLVRARSAEKNEKVERQAKRSRRGKLEADRGGIPRILSGARKRKAEATSGRIDSEESERVGRAREVLLEAQGRKRLDPFIRLDFESEARPASQVLITAENLELCWSKPLSFQIRARDRIYLRGKNGIGKSSLLELLMGRGRPFKGLLWRSALLGEAGRVGYLDQTQSSLLAYETVLETISKCSRFGVSEVRSELAFYGFTGDSVNRKVESLSGGERLRLALAQIFLHKQKPALLVLDEPTNNLDFQSIGLLEAAIEHFEGSVLLVTHDDVFRNSLGRSGAGEKSFTDLLLR